MINPFTTNLELKVGDIFKFDIFGFCTDSIQNKHSSAHVHSEYSLENVSQMQKKYCEPQQTCPACWGMIHPDPLQQLVDIFCTCLLYAVFKQGISDLKKCVLN